MPRRHWRRLRLRAIAKPFAPPSGLSTRPMTSEKSAKKVATLTELVGKITVVADKAKSDADKAASATNPRDVRDSVEDALKQLDTAEQLDNMVNRISAMPVGPRPPQTTTTTTSSTTTTSTAANPTKVGNGP